MWMQQAIQVRTTLHGRVTPCSHVYRLTTYGPEGSRGLQGDNVLVRRPIGERGVWTFVVERKLCGDAAISARFIARRIVESGITPSSDAGLVKTTPCDLGSSSARCSSCTAAPDSGESALRRRPGQSAERLPECRLRRIRSRYAGVTGQRRTGDDSPRRSVGARGRPLPVRARTSLAPTGLCRKRDGGVVPRAARISRPATRRAPT